MSKGLHHVMIPVRDMKKTVHLFRDLLGFQVLWRIPRVGGRQLAELMGIPNMEAEMAYLQGPADSAAVELIRFKQTVPAQAEKHSGPSGGFGLSLHVEDLDGLHRRVTEEGWPPFTPCQELCDPEGHPIRVFCIRTEDGLTIELMEKEQG